MSSSRQREMSRHLQSGPDRQVVGYDRRARNRRAAAPGLGRSGGVCQREHTATAARMGTCTRGMLRHAANQAGCSWNIPGWPGRFAFSPGGEMFALGEEGTGTVTSSVRRSGNQGECPRCRAHAIVDGLFPNGKILAAGFWDNSVGLWTLAGRTDSPLRRALSRSCDSRGRRFP